MANRALQNALKKRQKHVVFVNFPVASPYSEETCSGPSPRPGDHLFWFLPGAADRLVLQRLAEAGVRPLMLGDGRAVAWGAPYQLDWQLALATGLRQWQRESIQRIVVPRPALGSTSVTHALGPVLAELGLPMRVACCGEQSVVDYIRGLRVAKNEGLVFDDDLWLAHLCRDAAPLVPALLGRGRSLVMRSLSLAAAALAGARIDMLEVDWPAVARRIGRDLGQGRVPSAGPAVRFRAVWRPGIAIKELTRHFGMA